MNTPRAEAAIQVFSIVVIWFAFAFTWLVASLTREGLTRHGADLPDPTLIAFAVTDNGLHLIVPALFTVCIVWLIRRRSPYAGWAQSLLLSATVVLISLALFAFAMPNMPLCGGSV